MQDGQRHTRPDKRKAVFIAESERHGIASGAAQAAPPHSPNDGSPVFLWLESEFDRAQGRQIKRKQFSGDQLIGRSKEAGAGAVVTDLC